MELPRPGKLSFFFSSVQRIFYRRSFSSVLPASGASVMKADRVAHAYSGQKAQLSTLLDWQHLRISHEFSQWKNKRPLDLQPSQLIWPDEIALQ